jgi:multicomponent Na+:H+ antiporter subunit C
MSILAAAVVAWTFGIGVYGAVVSRNLIHLALCLSVSQSSTYILLLTVGYRHGAGAPIFKGVELGTPAVDPVVQALTLTDVVVEATVVAVLLALSVQAHKRFGTADPDKLGALRG